MDRCRHCLSDNLRSIHFRPLDFALILVGVRRYRCNFCSKVQSRSFVPWPLRWALGLVLLVALYFASAGPVGWLQEQNFFGGDAEDEKLFRRVYAPIVKILERREEDRNLIQKWYVGYVRLWTSDELAVVSPPPAADPQEENPNGDKTPWYTARPINGPEAPVVQPTMPPPP